MKKNTTSYQEDFQFDVRKLTAAVQAQDAGDRSFLWMSRPCGTWCLNERNIFIRDSFDHKAWTIYEDSSDRVKAFRVEVTGEDQGRPVGNVYPVDYKTQVPRIKRDAIRAEDVTLTFQHGVILTLPCKEAEGRQRNLTAEYGRIEKMHYNVKDEHELEALILAERRQPGPRARSAKAPPPRQAVR